MEDTEDMENVKNLRDLFIELSPDLTIYLDADELIKLSLVSTYSLFSGLNNLRFKRFIPSDNEAKNSGLLKRVIYRHVKSNGEIRRYIKASKDINAEIMLTDRNPLYLAIRRQKIGIVDAFIKAGADINIKDSDGRTPLDLARRGKKEREDFNLWHGGIDAKSEANYSNIINILKSGGGVESESKFKSCKLL